MKNSYFSFLVRFRECWEAEKVGTGIGCVIGTGDKYEDFIDILDIEVVVFLEIGFEALLSFWLNTKRWIGFS